MRPPISLAAVWLAFGLTQARPVVAQRPEAARRDSVRGGPMLEPVAVRAEADRAGPLPLAAGDLNGADALRGRAGLGLDEALALVPGLVAQNRYNYSLDTRITVRGFGARSPFGVRGLTVLLDGVPQTLPDGQTQLTNVDLDEVDQVAVVRGAAAAFYGNAAGGVISLRSAPLIGAHPAGRARALGGSFALARWSASGTAPLLGGGMRLSVARLSVDGFRAHSAARLTQGAFALELPLSATLAAAVRLRVADQPRADNPGALTDSLREVDPAAASPQNLALNAGKRVSQWQASVELVRREPAGESAVVLYGLSRDLDNPLATRRSGYVMLDRRGAGARLSGRRRLGPPARGIELSGGLDLQRQDDERRNFDNLAGAPGDTVRVDQSEVVDALGARAAVAVSLGARTRALGGVRYDRTRYRVEDRLLADGDDSGQRSMDAVSFTAGLTRRLGGAASAYANVGSAFETPTTTELADPGQGGLNTTLDPQRALQWEAGLLLAGRRGRASAAVYQTDVRDGLLAYEVPTAPGRNVFRNTGRTRHRGVELEALWRAPARLEVLAALALSGHRFVDFPTDSTPLDGRTLPGVPRWTLEVELRTGTWRGAWVAVTWRGTGRSYADDANTASEAPWTTLNLRATWEALGSPRRLRLFSGFNNVFGARYASALAVNGFGGRYFEPAPGRNWYLGAETTWEKREK